MFEREEEIKSAIVKKKGFFNRKQEKRINVNPNSVGETKVNSTGKYTNYQENKSDVKVNEKFNDKNNANLDKDKSSDLRQILKEHQKLKEQSKASESANNQKKQTNIIQVLIRLYVFYWLYQVISEMLSGIFK